MEREVGEGGGQGRRFKEKMLMEGNFSRRSWKNASAENGKFEWNWNLWPEKSVNILCIGSYKVRHSPKNQLIRYNHRYFKSLIRTYIKTINKWVISHPHPQHLILKMLARETSLKMYFPFSSVLEIWASWCSRAFRGRRPCLSSDGIIRSRSNFIYAVS